MANSILTEAGDKIVNETIAGVTNASSLNDVLVTVLLKETFETIPTSRGWQYGINWAYNASNKNMEPV
jgi:hypothetical protein